MYTHVHICTHHVIVWGGQGLGMVCSLFFCIYTLLFEIVSLAEARVHWFCHTSWPVSLWAPPATTHPLLGLRVCTTVPGFYVDAGDLNLGPHICAASGLTSEPSHQPYLFDSVIIVLRSPLKNVMRLWLEVWELSPSFYICVLLGTHQVASFLVFMSYIWPTL